MTRDFDADAIEAALGKLDPRTPAAAAARARLAAAQAAQKTKPGPAAPANGKNPS